MSPSTPVAASHPHRLWIPRCDGPVRLNATDNTALINAPQKCVPSAPRSPVATSRIRNVSSLLPDARRLPSGLKAKEDATRGPRLRHALSGRHVPHSHRLIVTPRRDAAPVGLNATDFTSWECPSSVATLSPSPRPSPAPLYLTPDAMRLPSGLNASNAATYRLE